MRNYCTASDPGGVTILNSNALIHPALKPRPSIAGEARATFYPGVPIQALTGEPWLTAAIPVASLCCCCVLTSGAAATCSERAEKALASVRVLPVFSPPAFETLLLPPPIFSSWMESSECGPELSVRSLSPFTFFSSSLSAFLAPLFFPSLVHAHATRACATACRSFIKVLY